jgi:phosphatidylglycerol phospholipase C
MPECWGHRGVSHECVPRYLAALLTLSIQASAAYPENTLGSFEAAIRDGAEGIESGILYRVKTVEVP